MKRESLITNAEKLLFDILETLKRIEDNTNPLPFVVNETVEENSVVKKTNDKTNDKSNKANVKKKPNAKKKG